MPRCRPAMVPPVQVCTYKEREPAVEALWGCQEAAEKLRELGQAPKPRGEDGGQQRITTLFRTEESKAALQAVAVFIAEEGGWRLLRKRLH